MSVGTQTQVNVSLAWGIPRLRWMTPRSPDEYLAIPEHESALCPQCGRAGSEYCGVYVCACDYRWRCPRLVGLD